MLDSRARTIGRYALFDEIAAGGMASVHLGRLVESLGFTRTVAIKRLHPQFAKDPQFVAMFLDEARVAARIRHPNVVPTLDIVATPGELFLVMEYVAGVPLSRLLGASRASGQLASPRIVAAVMCGVLNGLHAAHEATSDQGEPLGIVHRDISPQNILVGADGVARLIDFGVAKAAGRIHTTRDGKIKGKLSYMSPEQLQSTKIDRRTDIFAAGVVLWEVLTGTRLFVGESEGATINKVLSAPVRPPSELRPDLGEVFDAITLHALERSPSKRFQTAKEMALALQQAVGPSGLATTNEIGEWVDAIARDDLAQRAALVVEVEGTSSSGLTPSDVDAIASHAAAGHREVVGEVSSLSVSSAREQAPPRRRTLAYVAGVIALVGVVVAATLALSRQKLPAPVVSAQPPPPQSTIIERVVVAAPPPTSTSTASIVAVAPATATTIRQITRATPSASATVAGCDPPFTYVNGIKTYKSWCFGTR